MDIHQSSAARYQFFCRAACPGLILLGLFLLAISIRTSQFTCQRSSGQCTITHPGILPMPKTTFELGYLSRVLVERTESCCTSDIPIWYNLTIESGGLKKSYRLLYAWVNEETASAVLEPALDQVDQFMRNPTISEVTIRMPDNRREDLFCGIYFLAAGMAYTWINARIIFSRRTADLGLRPGQLATEGGSRLPGAEGLPLALSGKIGLKKKLSWGPEGIWLLWLITPWISVLLCLLAILGLYLLLSFLIGIGNYIDNLNFQAFSIGVIGGICLLLTYFTGQSWIIRRLSIKRFSWTAACVGAVMPLPIFGVILFILMNQYNFESLAYSQGRLSIFGLVIGTWIGLLQWLTLRSRVTHASWWILSSALISEALIVARQFIQAILPQAQSLLDAMDGSSGIPWLFLLCFLIIQGAILIYFDLGGVENPGVSTG